MVEKRRALGRGLGALIPSSPHSGGHRPVDVFFRDQPPAQAEHDAGAPVNETAPPVRSHDDSVAGASGVTVEHPGDEDRNVSGSSLDEPSASTASAEADDRDAGLTPVPGAEFAEIDIGAISPNPRQPRTVFDEDELAELVLSITEVGMLQPIVVRRVLDSASVGGDERHADGDEMTGDGGGHAGGARTGASPRFELIMGERRWRAAERAGLLRVPAIIKDTHDDDLLRDALLENLHRSQLNALEEAAAYQQLLDDFGCSHEQLASRIGRSRPQISNTLRLLRLPPLVQRRVAAGVLSAGHARAVLGLADGAAMERMAQRIVAEGLSVRTVEELVALGDDDSPPRHRRPRAGTRHPALDDLTSTLADRLETRVNIVLGQRKGKITVEFASMDDLKRIFEVMGVDADQR